MQTIVDTFSADPAPKDVYPGSDVNPVLLSRTGPIPFQNKLFSKFNMETFCQHTLHLSWAP